MIPATTEGKRILTSRWKNAIAGRMQHRLKRCFTLDLGTSISTTELVGFLGHNAPSRSYGTWQHVEGKMVKLQRVHHHLIKPRTATLRRLVYVPLWDFLPFTTTYNLTTTMGRVYGKVISTLTHAKLTLLVGRNNCGKLKFHGRYTCEKREYVNNDPNNFISIRI